MRVPTTKEKVELLDFHMGRRYHNPYKEATIDEWAVESQTIDNIWISVFDDYITDGPGYAGRVMVVVWGGAPEFTETFVWTDNKLKRVEVE